MSASVFPVPLSGIQEGLIAAKGDLIVGLGNDNPGILTAGTTNQVLTVDSSTTTGLKWAAASSGGMTLISSGSIASGGLTVSSITNTYTDIYIYIHSVRFDTDNKYYGVWFNNASGTGKYFYRLNANDSSGTPNPDTYIRFGTSKQYTTSTNALGILVRNYAGTSGPKPVFFSGMNYDGTTNNVMWGGGTTNTNSAIDRFDVQNAPGGGNFTQGSYELWGIK